MKHNKADDAWLVVDNKVYDMTDFAPNHPGGSDSKYRAILNPRNITNSLTITIKSFSNTQVKMQATHIQRSIRRQ